MPTHRRRLFVLLLLTLPSLAGPASAQNAWQQIFPGGAPPPARFGLPAILDVPRDRMVFFGGWSAGTYFNDTWTVNLSGPPAWTSPTIGGPPPQPRLEHTAIFDPVRNRMWVFGGKDQLGFFNDLWSLDLPGMSWTPVSYAPGPVPSRRETRAIYDPVGDRILILLGFGESSNGSGAYIHLNEVWSFDLASLTWSTVVTAGPAPPPRRGHTAVYDEAHHRVIVFGGYDDVRFMNDTWTLDLTQTPPRWDSIATAVVPPARYGHAAVFDPVAQRLVVFGGYGPAAGTYFDEYRNDTWELQLSGTPAWSALATIGTPPSVRDFPAYIADPLRSRMLVFGGNDGAQDNELWELSMRDQPVPALASLATVDASAERVRIEWQLDGSSVTPEVSRCIVSGECATLGSVTPVSSSRVAFEDRDVEPGAEYTYRLMGMIQGQPATLSAVHVQVPLGASLALAGFVPDPGAGQPTVEFTLPSQAPGRLELFDISGRRRYVRDLGSLGEGTHRSRLDVPLGPGVYIVQLSHGGHRLTRRATLVR